MDEQGFEQVDKAAGRRRATVVRNLGDNRFNRFGVLFAQIDHVGVLASWYPTLN